MITNIIGQELTAQTSSADKFCAIQIGGGTFATLETGLQGRNVMPVAGTLRNFYVSMDTGPGAGITRSFIIRKNGVDQSLSTSISGTTTANDDTANAVSFVAGDTISVHTNATTTTASSGKIRWTLAADCAPNVSMLLGNSGVNMGTIFPVYVGVQGQSFDSSTSTNVESPIPTNGTIRNAYVQLSGAMASGKDLQFTLFQNGNPTSLVASLSGAVSTGNDTTHSVTVVAGDKLLWKVTSTVAPATLNVAISAEFDPVIDGESVQMFATTTPNPTTNVTRFMSIMANNNVAYQTSDPLAAGLTQACTWQKLFIVSQTAIISGTITMQPAIGGVAAGPTAQINSTNQTSANDTTNTTLSSVGQNISMRMVTVSPSAASIIEWGIVSYIPPPFSGAMFGSNEFAEYLPLFFTTSTSSTSISSTSTSISSTSTTNSSTSVSSTSSSTSHSTSSTSTSSTSSSTSISSTSTSSTSVSTSSTSVSTSSTSTSISSTSSSTSSTSTSSTSTSTTTTLPGTTTSTSTSSTSTSTSSTSSSTSISTSSTSSSTSISTSSTSSSTSTSSTSSSTSVSSTSSSTSVSTSSTSSSTSTSQSTSTSTSTSISTSSTSSSTSISTSSTSSSISTSSTSSSTSISSTSSSTSISTSSTSSSTSTSLSSTSTSTTVSNTTTSTSTSTSISTSSTSSSTSQSTSTSISTSSTSQSTSTSISTSSTSTSISTSSTSSSTSQSTSTSSTSTSQSTSTSLSTSSTSSSNSTSTSLSTSSTSSSTSTSFSTSSTSSSTSISTSTTVSFTTSTSSTSSTSTSLSTTTTLLDLGYFPRGTIHPIRRHTAINTRRPILNNIRRRLK